jgi:hypothetical protein
LVNSCTGIDKKRKQLSWHLSIALLCMFGEHFCGPNLIVIFVNWQKIMKQAFVPHHNIRLSYLGNIFSHFRELILLVKVIQCGFHLVVIRLTFKVWHLCQ